MPVAHFRSASVRGLRRRKIETATCPHPVVARLGDVPLALLLARAPLARREPQIGLDLVRALEAMRVVDGRRKGRSGDRAYAGRSAEPLHRLIALCEML